MRNKLVCGLLHTSLFLIALALVVYEIGAVVVNSVQLDGMADYAARSAATAAAAHGSHASVESAVRESLAQERGVVLDALVYDDQQVTVSISRAPQFVLAQRIPTFEERFRGRATHSEPVT